jgi:putative sterol carrier protein
MIDPKEYLFALPHKTDPFELEGHFTNFHFEVDGSGHFTVQVEDGRMAVLEGLNGVPVCRVVTNAESFSAIIRRDMNPMAALMSGKLKISNPGELMKFARIFGLI